MRIAPTALSNFRYVLSSFWNSHWNRRWYDWWIVLDDFVMLCSHTTSGPSLCKLMTLLLFGQGSVYFHNIKYAMSSYHRHRFYTWTVHTTHSIWIIYRTAVMYTVCVWTGYFCRYVQCSMFNAGATNQLNYWITHHIVQPQSCFPSLSTGCKLQNCPEFAHLTAWKRLLLTS